MTNSRQSLRPALFLVVTLLAACGGGGGGSPGPSPTLVPTATPTVPGATPTPPATPIPTLPPQAARLIVPATGAYLGAYVNPVTSSPIPTPPANESDLTAFEGQVGRKMALTQHYYAWTDPFPGVAVNEDYSENRVPIESWGCGDTDANVANGVDDDTILKPQALKLKNLGKPIFLRWFWDMNTPSTATFRSQCYDPATDGANGAFSPSEYIAAWQHIWTVFQQQGATNVIFVWAPSSVGGVPSGLPYYPGAGFVDWIGLDRFDYQTTNVPFLQNYATAYQQLSSFDKPIMIAETGAFAAQQQAYFDPTSGPSDVTVLQTQLPFVKAYVYFDAVYNNYTAQPGGLHANYILSNPTAPGNFATFAANPYFAPFPNLAP